MHDRPPGIDDDALVSCLSGAWGLDVGSVEYAPVGFGSYHWVVADAAGARHIVSVDHHDRKPWLGSTRAAALDGLRRAFDCGAALHEAGLEFVVAPLRSRSGETAVPLGDRFAAAVFPFVEGETRAFGRYETAGERVAVLGLLAELHRATPVVTPFARRHELAVPGRRALEDALRRVGRPWDAGPLSEPARDVLAANAADVCALLAAFDRLAAAVSGHEAGWVITHGEPHAGNVIRTRRGLALVDWDTAALAPPERDLWLVLEPGGDDAGAYAEATGHAVDPVALDLFAVGWDLADVAAFVGELRSPHRETADTVAAYENLAACVRVGARWARLLS